MTLVVNNLTVAYGDVHALTNVSLSVERGEVCALMGRSGSGKSSLLRAAAGIVPMSSGTIRIGNRDISTLPIHERRIGLMFQSYALFPHLNVAENISFGISKDSGRDHRVSELLEMVDLTGFEERSVADLSGGEQQRVALARTLAPSPDVLFLDEPLGSLDTALRQALLADMGAIFATMDIPVIYVTHDPDEAFAIADSITVLDNGAVDAQGPPSSLWIAPPTVTTALLLDRESVVDAADLPAPVRGTRTGTVLVPTEAVQLAEAESRNVINATVRHVVFAGLTSRATVQCGNATLTLDTTANLSRDQRIDLIIDSTAVISLTNQRVLPS